MSNTAEQLAARLELEQQLQAAVQEAADGKQSLLEAKQQLAALQIAKAALQSRVSLAKYGLTCTWQDWSEPAYRAQLHTCTCPSLLMLQLPCLDLIRLGSHDRV